MSTCSRSYAEPDSSASILIFRILKVCPNQLRPYYQAKFRKKCPEYQIYQDNKCYLNQQSGQVPIFFLTMGTNQPLHNYIRFRFYGSLNKHLENTRMLNSFCSTSNKCSHKKSYLKQLHQ